MKAIAFFPWWPLKKVIEVPGYRIIPYVRGKEPFVDDSASQSLVDEILEPYKFFISAKGDNRPINSAAIVQIDEDIFIGDMTDNLAQDLFVLTEILCISGIANNRYFTHSNYCNRTMFRLVIHPIERDNDWFAIKSRRRDGSTQNLTGRKDASIRMPEQARTPLVGVELDGPFAEALLIAKNQLDHESWLGIYDAILYFNLANTDSSDMAMQSELILTVSSMERIVGSEFGKADDLVKRVKNTIQHFFKLDDLPERRIDGKVRNRKIFKKPDFAEEIWLRDIFKVRSKLAHGEQSHKYSSVWSPWEHLLLGAHFIPLLVKSRLAKLGLYSLTDGDEDKIRAFPRLLNEGFDADDVDEEDIKKWNSIISSEGMRRAHREFMKQLEGESPISTNQ